MTFEEQFLKEFPSVHDYTFEKREYCRTCVQFVAHLPQINHKNHEIQINHYLGLANVKAYCIDKAKVKEVIDKELGIPHMQQARQLGKTWLVSFFVKKKQDIYKELGLE